jgi:hypothetical protein
VWLYLIWLYLVWMKVVPPKGLAFTR